LQDTETQTSALSPRFADIYQRLQREPLTQEPIYGCLDQLLRLFTGLAAGLVRHLEPGRPEISALASGLDKPIQYERLLRFALNLLQTQPAAEPLIEVFFPTSQPEDRSLPLHTAWLQESSSLPPLSRWKIGSLEAEALLPRYREVLDGWLAAARPLLKRSAWEASHQELLSWQLEGMAGRVFLLPPCPWEPAVSLSDSSEWSPQWTPSQFESIQSILNKSPRPGSPPKFILHPLQQKLAQSSSGYLLLEGPEGSGKSLALAGLPDALELEVLSFPVRAHFRGDFQTFIEEIDEGIRTIQPLGSLVIQELNRRYSQPAEKFQAYLSQLMLRNGQRFLLVFDGLDEIFEGGDGHLSLADYLPEQLPDGVFLFLSYRFEGCSLRLQRRISQLSERRVASLTMPVQSPAYLEWCERIVGDSAIVAAGYPLLEARLLAQNHQFGLRTQEVLPELLAHLEERWGDPFLRLLMVLATSFTPVPLLELSDLGFAPRMVASLLEEFPNLFLIHPEGIQLAHEKLRLHLQEHYSHRYSLTCQRLAARAAHQLMANPMFEEPDAQLASFRLDSLYRWLLDSQNLELMESVVSTAELRSLRNHVCAYLEQKGRYHHKLFLLQGLKSCLETVLHQRDSTDLRDELAWAYNSRGLTYLHLGQFQRGLAELQEAELHFRQLVEQRNLIHYRSGLASALNRRSEALRALTQIGEAWECAHQSVEHHRQAIQEGGPQQPRLGLARALVQRANCAADHSLWPKALSDLQEALTILEQSTRQAQARAQQNDIAAHFQEWIKALVVRSQAYRINGEHDNCLLDLDQALLLTQHLEEIQGLEWDQTKAPEVQILQAQAYQALQGYEEALEAYDEAIVGFSKQVRQGRLDLRLALAEAFHARAELRSQRGSIDSALEDFTRSLALQAQLIECEEQADLRPFRAQTYQGRGDAQGRLERRREALQDYDKAIEDYLYGLNSSKLQQAGLRRLASVYFESGRLHLELGEASQAADRAASAVSLYHDRLTHQAEELAQAYLLRAQALYQLQDYAGGLEVVSRAIEVLSLRVQNNTERKLAEAHRLRAQLAQAQGDVVQALKDYGLALHLFGGESTKPNRLAQAEVLRSRAGLQAKIPDIEAALEDVQSALDLLSDYPQRAANEIVRLRRLRATLLVEQGRTQQAIGELLGSLDELRQPNQDTQEYLGVLMELLNYQARLQQWSDFSILYSEFLRVRPPDASLDEQIQKLFANIEADVPQRMEQRVARADVLVALARLLQSSAAMAFALQERGLQNSSRGRLTEALEDFSEGIAQLRSQPSPDSEELLVELYIQRAQGLLQSGLESRALRDLEQASQLHPNRASLRAQLLIQKCTLLRRQGQAAAVICELKSVLTELAAQAPEASGWLYLARALAHDELQEHERAVADYKEAAQLLAQFPDNLQALQERLRCRLRLLQLEEPTGNAFLLYCAEDAGVCISRLRQHDPSLAAPWLLAWVQQLQVHPRLLNQCAEELSHYQPGPLTPAQCHQLALLIGGLASRAAQIQPERLIGIALHLTLLSERSSQAPLFLDLLTLLYRIYRSNGDYLATLDLRPIFKALAELQAFEPPQGELGVRWNNLCRAWLQLSDPQLAACRIERGTLQSLRLW
jgi:tetratricopeptide (TPR) repeat protein